VVPVGEPEGLDCVVFGFESVHVFIHLASSIPHGHNIVHIILTTI